MKYMKYKKINKFLVCIFYATAILLFGCNKGVPSKRNFEYENETQKIGLNLIQGLSLRGKKFNIDEIVWSINNEVYPLKTIVKSNKLILLVRKGDFKGVKNVIYALQKFNRVDDFIIISEPQVYRKMIASDVFFSEYIENVYYIYSSDCICKIPYSNTDNLIYIDKNLTILESISPSSFGQNIFINYMNFIYMKYYNDYDLPLEEIKIDTRHGDNFVAFKISKEINIFELLVLKGINKNYLFEISSFIWDKKKDCFASILEFGNLYFINGNDLLTERINSHRRLLELKRENGMILFSNKTISDKNFNYSVHFKN